MKRSPCSRTGKINILKMAVILKMMYTFITIPNKISVAWLIELEKTILKIILTNKRLQTVKGILPRETTAGGIPVPDLKLYYRAIVTKTAGGDTTKDT